MNVYNGKIIDLQNYRLINGATVTLTNNDLLAGGVTSIYLEGTNTLTLPAILDDSTYIDLVVISGSTTVTNTIDGTANRVYSTPKQITTLARTGSEYSVTSQVFTDKERVFNSGIEFFFSTANSTIAQLASGATFTGVIEDITTYPALSLMAFADQDLTVTVRQFIDAGGTKIAEENQYSLVANEKLYTVTC